MSRTNTAAGTCVSAEKELTLTISRFWNKFDKQPIHKQVSWSQLLKMLGDFKFTADKDSVQLWCPSRFKPHTTRRKRYVLEVYALVWDYDNGTTFEQALKPWTDWPFACHTTHSHTTEHPKFRVIIPFAEPVDAKRWPEVWTYFYDQLEYKPDVNCKDASRMYYLPSAPVGSACTRHEGRNYHSCGFLRVPWDEIRVPRKEAAELRALDDLPIVRCPDSSLQHLNFKPKLRRKVAHILQCETHGVGVAEVARGACCPSCGRSSVWFAINPRRANHSKAQCNHKTTSEKGGCDWSGDIVELTLASLEVAK